MKKINLNDGQQAVNNGIQTDSIMAEILKKGCGRKDWEVQVDGERCPKELINGQIFTQSNNGRGEGAGHSQRVTVTINGAVYTVVRISADGDTSFSIQGGQESYTPYDLAMEAGLDQKSTAKMAGLCEFGFKAEEVDRQETSLKRAVECVKMMGPWYRLEHTNVAKTKDITLYRKGRAAWEPVGLLELAELIGQVNVLPEAQHKELHFQLRTSKCLPSGKDSMPDGKLAVQNGILNLKTGELEEEGDTFFTFRSIAEYDPNAESELVDKLLYGLDPRTVTSLLRMVAYWLMPHQKLKSFFYVYGDGDTGKSTLMRVFKLLMFGSEEATGQVAALNLKSTFGGESQFPFEHLVDMQVAIAPEAGAVKVPESEELKGITGGDAITVNRKNKTAISVMLPVKLVLVSNHPPRFADKSGATAARMRLLDMTRYQELRKKWDILATFYNDKTFQSALLNRVIKEWKFLDEQVQKSSENEANLNPAEIFPITEKAENMMKEQASADFPLLQFFMDERFFKDDNPYRWFGYSVDEFRRLGAAHAKLDDYPTHGILNMTDETVRSYLRKLSEGTGLEYEVVNVTMEAAAVKYGDGSKSDRGFRGRGKPYITFKNSGDALIAKLLAKHSMHYPLCKAANDNWLRKHPNAETDLKKLEESFGSVKSVPLCPGETTAEEEKIYLQQTIAMLKGELSRAAQERDMARELSRRLEERYEDPTTPFGTPYRRD